jgi:site-specific recombinase XerD
MKKTEDFHYYISSFLAGYLPGEAGASENTVLSYRDTFTLLLKYCKTEKSVMPERMSLDLMTKELVVSFLGWLESERSCSVSTRNQRLAAIHSFCRFMLSEDITRMNQYQQILAITKKKTASGSIEYLSIEGVGLILKQPQTVTRSGYRDLVLLSLMYDSGAIVQETADLSAGDVRTESPSTVKITGKGRKTRILPLMAPTANLVKEYIARTGLSDNGKRSCPLFPNRSGGNLTRAGIKYIIDKYVIAAREENSAILPENISPHSFRHSKAMHLLQAGMNLVYIRDILGHADLKTTEIYARIDGEMKRKALESAYPNITPSDVIPIWQQDNDLLAWLQNLGKTD